MLRIMNRLDLVLTRSDLRFVSAFGSEAGEAILRAGCGTSRSREGTWGRLEEAVQERPPAGLHKGLARGLKRSGGTETGTGATSQDR